MKLLAEITHSQHCLAIGTCRGGASCSYVDIIITCPNSDTDALCYFELRHYHYFDCINRLSSKKSTTNRESLRSNVTKFRIIYLNIVTSNH